MGKRSRGEASNAGVIAPVVAEEEDAAPVTSLLAVPAKEKKGGLTLSSVTAFNEAERAKGVVYLARVPPYMRPIKVKQLLSAYGEVGRVYLAPEDAGAYARRVRAGGNKRLQFTEGWVEFLDKRIARATAESIHNARVGDGLGVRGRARRGFYGDDLWSVQYLRGFKWHHLTEMSAYERRVKGVRLRAALSGARKDADAFLLRVEQAQGLAAQAKRRKGANVTSSLSAASGGGGGGPLDSAQEEAAALANARRHFRQREPIPEAGDSSTKFSSNNTGKGKKGLSKEEDD